MVDVVILHYAGNNAAGISEAIGGIQDADYLATEMRPNKGLIEKLRFTVDPKTHYPYGWAVPEEGVRRITRSLNEFDAIWFFKLRSADMFPNLAWQRSVVDIDDVQSTYERAALGNGSPLERFRTLRNLYIWRRRERMLGQRFSVLAVCSEEDKTYLRSIGVGARIHVIPNGFEEPFREPARSPVIPPRLGFIGGFDHLPNRDGISWFVKSCWPQIKREVPQARLRLVGRDSDRFPDVSGLDVDRLGWVENPSDEIKTWIAMIVPIRLGAGTRVKIAHAFSQKCPIVSTSLGALGYGVVDRREMYLADSAEAFGRACINVICAPGEAERMAQRAWFQFLEKWTWHAIRPRVWAAVEDCLSS